MTVEQAKIDSAQTTIAACDNISQESLKNPYPRSLTRLAVV